MTSRAAGPLLTLASTFVCIFVFELGLRVAKQEWRLIDFRAESLDLLRSAYPVRYDARLGWAPKPGSGRRNVWNVPVTISGDGLRVDPSAPARSGPGILAVGDSFVFGDEVADDHTWPAKLERSLNRPVHNGGVFGYGLDQIYLRAEALLPSLRPEVLIFGFIPVDVMRTKLSMRQGVSKPYFRWKGDEAPLSLENVPAPKPLPRRFSALARPFGYSLLAHTLMLRLRPQSWIEGSNADKVEKAHDDAIAVSCRLLRQLPDLAQKYSVRRTIVLVQYLRHPHREELSTAGEVLSCVDRRRVEVLDLKEPLLTLRKLHPSVYENFYGRDHLSPPGNAWVAAAIKDHLEGRAVLGANLDFRP